MVILALDVGLARIGVAVSDATETLATPRGMIRRTSATRALDAIARAIAETRAELVVVGLPLSLDGSVGPQAQAVQAFTDRLRRCVDTPIVLWDERYSTLEAADALRAAGVRPERARARLDAAAAAVILQNYLDRPRELGESDLPRSSSDSARLAGGESAAGGDLTNQATPNGPLAPRRRR